MKIKNRLFLALIARKNRQIRLERERCRALEQTNTVLSAYVGLLVARCGGVAIPKSLVSKALGCYKLSVSTQGDCYTVSVQCDSDLIDACAAKNIRTDVVSLSDDGDRRSDIEDGDEQI